jgi:cytoskeletal protein CcmA (bactofilin family)
MAIPILNHLNVKGNLTLNDYKLQDFVVDHSTTGDAGNTAGKLIYDSGTLKYYDGSNWQSLGTSSGTMSSWVLEDGDGTEKSITDADEVKFIDGAGLQINFTGSGDGSDGDPIDLTFEIALSTNDFTKPAPASGDVFLTLDNDGSTTQYTTVDALATLFAGTGLTATDGVIAVDTLNQDTTGTAAKVTVTDSNSDTAFPLVFHDESNSLLDDTGTLTYNPNSGLLTAPGEIVAASLDISGNIDVDGTANLDNTDIDGTLAVDGTTISLDATTSLNIDNSNTTNGITIGTATAGVPVSIGHTTSEVTVNDNLTVTGNLTVSGDTITANVGTLQVEDKNVVLNYNGSSDTSSTADGAGITIQDAVDASNDASMSWNAASDKFVFSHLIEAPGTSIFSALDVSGDVDIDGTTNLDAVDIDGAVQIDAGVTVGVNDTGYDVKFFGDTANKYLLWDASADTLILTGELDAGSLDISGDADIDGTLEADAITVGGTALNTVIDNRIKVVQKTATIDVSSLVNNVFKCNIAHGMNSNNLIVKLYDGTTYLDVFADIDRTDANTLQITFSHEPSNDIIVVIQEIIGDNISAGSDITYPSS